MTDGLDVGPPSTLMAVTSVMSINMQSLQAAFSRKSFTIGEIGMVDFERKAKQLAPDDRVRMQTLSAEIQDRIKEMVSIFGKTLDVQIDESFILQFQPESPAGVKLDVPSYQHIKLVCAGINGPCGCYVDPPGECIYTGSPMGC